MNNFLKINDPLESLQGFGPSLSKKFSSIGLECINDLINYFPRKYVDYSNVIKIKDIKPGEVVFIANIDQITNRYTRRGLVITEAIAYDDSGLVKLIWFNQSYRKKSIQTDKKYLINGKFGLQSNRLVVNNPSIELVSDFPVNSARIVPIYRATKEISSRQIRQNIAKIFRSRIVIPEYLPKEILKQYNLISLNQAYYQIHFPSSFDDLKKAQRRIAFNEVLNLMLASQYNRHQLAKTHSLKIKPDLPLIKKFIKQLPFQLTNSQRQVIWQIMLDLKKDYPMNRLVEGDVGSGKTMVALIASLSLIKQGYQVCFIAPTEVLARQHYLSMISFLEKISFQDKICLLIGSLSSKEKNTVKQNIKLNKCQLIIGTHALLQPDVVFNNLALVIVDEQHRFGVKQRQALQTKTTYQPHLLSLSATPIPRSLALTIFGELSISRLVEKPNFIQPVKTMIVEESKLSEVYDLVKKRLDLKEQAFIVCPAINDDIFFQGKNVESVYQDLKNHVFGRYRVGLIHGKLKSKDKNQVMDQFVKHNLDVLVATTVIEVGVDVPRATLMIILDADQFGLAQIHQLRGRVGRRDKPGYCYLVGDEKIKQNQRINILKKYNDGFYLAEEDLKLRGPGSIYGNYQHGLFDLRFADLDDDILMSQARSASQQIFNNDPDLLQYQQILEKIDKLNNISNLN